jgi:hypothetical protein
MVLNESCHLLGYSAINCVFKPTFRRNLSPKFSGLKIGRVRNQRVAGSYDTFLRNVGSHTDYTVLCRRAWKYSIVKSKK